MGTAVHCVYLDAFFSCCLNYFLPNFEKVQDCQSEEFVQVFTFFFVKMVSSERKIKKNIKNVVARSALMTSLGLILNKLGNLCE